MKGLLIALVLLASSVQAATLSGKECARVIANDLQLKNSEWVILAEGFMPVVEHTNRLHYDENGIPGRVSSRYQCANSKTYRRVWVDSNEGTGNGLAPWRKVEQP